MTCVDCVPVGLVCLLQVSTSLLLLLPVTLWTCQTPQPTGAACLPQQLLSQWLACRYRPASLLIPKGGHSTAQRVAAWAMSCPCISGLKSVQTRGYTSAPAVCLWKALGLRLRLICYLLYCCPCTAAAAVLPQGVPHHDEEAQQTCRAAGGDGRATCRCVWVRGLGRGVVSRSAVCRDEAESSVHVSLCDGLQKTTLTDAQKKSLRCLCLCLLLYRQ
jgi:hypothetical protein